MCHFLFGAGVKEESFVPPDNNYQNQGDHNAYGKMIVALDIIEKYVHCVGCLKIYHHLNHMKSNLFLDISKNVCGKIVDNRHESKLKSLRPYDGYLGILLADYLHVYRRK